MQFHFLPHHFFVLIIISFGFVFAQSPCRDARYLELKGKALDSMSQREYDYFLEKERACNNTVTKIPIDSCTISVGVDRNYYIRQSLGGDKEYAINVGVYIDSIYYGQPPQAVKVTAGNHIVSLFKIGDDWLDQTGLFDDDQIENALIKVNCRPNERIRVLFQFNCNLGGNGRCDPDEWYYTPTLER
jgi:hypothetical protein